MIGLVGAIAALSIGQTNLITNGSFEDLTGDSPKGWSTTTWGGKATFRISDSGRNGGKCAVIDSKEGADAGWTTHVSVLPMSTYKLTAWIKSEDIKKTDGQGALLNLHSRKDHTEPLTGTHDWTKVETTIETGTDDSIQVNCLLGYYGKASGTVYFDDVQLQLLATRPFDPKATIDGSKKGEPISKYIYSQFIEHLGRCIYGGIWAEMLEDRKFFEPVGKRGSPWKVVGKATMVEKDAFVGDHTPEVSGTLSQGDLWLEKGKKYVGRIWLAGNAESVAVSLTWGNNPKDKQTVHVHSAGTKYNKTSFEFIAGADTKKGQLSISAENGTYRVGTVSLMPSDNVAGMRKDTLAVLRELNSPLYRWPGGNFVSGYDWRDGVGDPDRRPPRKNPAWRGIEHNDFGLHEFLRFCKEIKTEPMVVVNTGFGDSHTAAEELEYVNGASDSTMGKWRVKNGAKDPWGVKWWGVGNEMFGPWQLGYMALDQYELKHNEFVKKMRKVDPNIKLLGVGDTGNWSRGMLAKCADSMDLISEHFYCQEKPGVMGHAGQIPAAIRHKAEEHRKYRKEIPALKGKDIRIAMDEWNFWYGPEVFGELGTRYFMKDALGIAEGLHEYYRNSDIIFMANYAQTVNVIGAVKTTPTQVALETTGLVLKMYHDHFGVIPLKVSGTPEPLDVSAATSSDGKTLTLAVVNPTGEAANIPLTIKGITTTGSGRTWTIASSDPMAYNDPGKKPKVSIVSGKCDPWSGNASVGAYSITVFEFEVKKQS